MLGAAEVGPVQRRGSGEAERGGLLGCPAVMTRRVGEAFLRVRDPAEGGLGV